jgi:hypothetical protein
MGIHMGYDNPFSGQSPILGPMSRAYQMYALIQNLKNDAADRQFRQEQAQLENQFRERQFSRHDANDEFQRKKYEESVAREQQGNAIEQSLKMAELGAQPINNLGDWFFKTHKEKDAQGNERVVGPQGAFIPNVSGAQGGYALPSYDQQTQRAMQEIIRKGQLGVANEIAKAHALLPYDAAKAEAAARARAQYAQGPAPRMVQTEAGGYGIDPRTGKTVWSNPELAKPKTTSEKQLTPGALLEKKTQFEEMKTKAAQLFLVADDLEATGDKKKIALANSQRLAARNQLRLAKALARQIKIADPRVEVGGIGEDDDEAPWVK